MLSQTLTRSTLTLSLALTTFAHSALAQCEEPWFEPRVIAKATIIGTLDANNTGWLELATTNLDGLTVWTLDDGSEPVPTTVYTGSVESAVIADFDQDGRDDIAALTSDPLTLRIFQNAGDTWPEISVLPLAGGTFPTLLVLDAFDDGIPDLIHVHTDSIDLLLNDGAGTFAAGTPVAPGNAGGIWVVNVDTDPRQDLVLAFGGSPGTTVAYIQQPDGSFLPGTAIEFYAEKVGDVTGDGYADLVRGHNSTIQLASALGDGSFNAPETIIPEDVRPKLLADLDADGDQDLLTYDFALKTLVPYLNQGDASFLRHPQLSFAMTRFVAEDVNRDGITDLVGPGSHGTAIFRGRGDGSFYAPQGIEAIGLVRRMALADLDADGDQDIVVIGDRAGGRHSGFAVLKNTGAGNLELVTSQAGSALDRDDTFEAPILADFDADGDLDIAFWSGSEIILIENTPDGLYSSRSMLPAPSAVLGLLLLSADFDGNGFPDLVLVDDNYVTYTLRLIFNHGEWNFITQTQEIAPYQHPIGITDANGDGLDDIILSTNASGHEIAVLPSLGNGSFASLITSDVNQNAYWSYPGDFDNDGDRDLLTVKTGNKIVLLRNDGTGRFEDMGTVASYSYPRGIGVADLNNDGFDDFIAGSQTTPDSAIHFSNGDGSFSDGMPLWIQRDGNRGMVTAVATDMNGDNSLDLVLAYNLSSGGPGFVAVQLNQCGPPGCRVDLNADNFVDTRDLLRYLQLWAARFPIADWNHDGTINTADLTAFLNDWTIGCD